MNTVPPPPGGAYDGPRTPKKKGYFGIQGPPREFHFHRCIIDTDPKQAQGPTDLLRPKPGEEPGRKANVHAGDRGLDKGRRQVQHVLASNMTIVESVAEKLNEIGSTEANLRRVCGIVGPNWDVDRFEPLELLIILIIFIIFMTIF